MPEELKCNRTNKCTLCRGRNTRERRQVGPTENDVFFICPRCDAPEPSRQQRGR